MRPLTPGRSYNELMLRPASYISILAGHNIRKVFTSLYTRHVSWL